MISRNRALRLVLSDYLRSVLAQGLGKVIALSLVVLSVVVLATQLFGSLLCNFCCSKHFICIVVFIVTNADCESCRRLLRLLRDLNS